MDEKLKQKRPCTISESLAQACQEVKKMRNGTEPKHSLTELYENIERWRREDTKD